MSLKSSIITSDTKDKSLKHLRKKSYNSKGLIKYKLVVSAFNTGIHKTSKSFNVSRTTLKNWGKKINQNIDITKVLPGRGRKSILNNTTHKEFISDTLKENPNLTLRELIIELKQKLNLDISKSSLQRYLKKNL